MRNGQGSKQKIQWGAVAGQLYKVTRTDTQSTHIQYTQGVIHTYNTHKAYT